MEGSRLGGVTLRRRRRNMDYYSMSYDVMREHEDPDYGIEQ